MTCSGRSRNVHHGRTDAATECWRSRPPACAPPLAPLLVGKRLCQGEQPGSEGPAHGTAPGAGSPGSESAPSRQRGRGVWERRSFPRTQATRQGGSALGASSQAPKGQRSDCPSGKQPADVSLSHRRSPLPIPSPTPAGEGGKEKKPSTYLSPVFTNCCQSPGPTSSAELCEDSEEQTGNIPGEPDRERKPELLP